MYKKEYYQKNKSKYHRASRKWLKENKWYYHYQSAKQRCNNPKVKKYKHYGGRGIKMLMTSKDFKFLWFRDKAYNMKQPSIDRKNNNKNYTLKNCRFIEMQKNRKSTIFSKGSKHHNAILDTKQVKQIRKNYAKDNITYQKLATKFKVSYHAIYSIVHYRTWKHI